MVVRASLEHVSAILQRFDGGGVVDLALAEFFEPDFGVLGEVDVPKGRGWSMRGGLGGGREIEMLGNEASIKESEFNPKPRQLSPPLVTLGELAGHACRELLQPQCCCPHPIFYVRLSSQLQLQYLCARLHFDHLQQNR